jgi:hypothetical protein
VGNYTVAILIIGSLIWDKREHRVSWRQDRLKAGPGIPVESPIRYGRISDNREKTYTMVFSNELLPARLGWALAMPCRYFITNADQLVNEAQALWAAEQSSRSPPGPVSAKWGAVGLLPNPVLTTLDTIRAGWARRVAEEADRYAQFPHADGEQAAVSRDGILRIPWPTAESGVPVEVDLLLATATVPCLHNGSYATHEAIAKEWKRAPKEQRYFDENRRAGITTADDYRIMKYLCQETT